MNWRLQAEKIGAMLYALITLLCIPILLLSAIVTAWTRGLQASDKHAVEHALGSKNLVLAGALGISGSLIWPIGTVVLGYSDAQGFLILLLSMSLWITVLAKSPFGADASLAQFFESIPRTKDIFRAITALVICTSINVVSFAIMMLCGWISPTRPASNTVDSSNSPATAALDGLALPYEPIDATPQPKDVDCDSQIPGGGLASANLQNPSSGASDNATHPEIQDGAG